MNEVLDTAPAVDTATEAAPLTAEELVFVTDAPVTGDADLLGYVQIEEEAEVI